ncbi:MAG: hypothetical protein BM556_14805 [Bacteriovorax sp. MedPE-SWde]|nr:MAG: hypothetical protein BM556_14805 [Bacteriovorax sp. MedPE-SWde]
MKKLLVLAVSIISVTASANFMSFEVPDFDEYEAMSAEFSKDVEAIKSDKSVVELVSFIEDQNDTSCSSTDKDTKAFVSYYVRYKCENGQKIKIKARIKNDKVSVLGYKIK